MSRQLDSASDAASSVGGASDAGSESGKSEAGSQGDQAADILKESKFSLKVHFSNNDIYLTVDMDSPEVVALSTSF